MKLEKPNLNELWEENKLGQRNFDHESYLYFLRNEEIGKNNEVYTAELRGYAEVVEDTKRWHTVDVDDDLNDGDPNFEIPKNNDLNFNITNGILLKISDQLERIADALEKRQNDEH